MTDPGLAVRTGGTLKSLAALRRLQRVVGTASERAGSDIDLVMALNPSRGVAMAAHRLNARRKLADDAWNTFLANRTGQIFFPTSQTRSSIVG